MKIDIDTLIYLIVMLIFVALGAVGKKKRPAANAGSKVPEGPPDAMDENSPMDAFSKNFSRFMGDYGMIETEEAIQNDIPLDEEIAESAIEKRTDTLDTVEDSLDSMDDALDQVEEIDYYAHIEDSIKLSELTMKDSGEEKIDEIKQIIDDFDIRSAIIYAEIIEPKYF